MSEIKLTADSGGGTTSLKAPSSTTSNADVVLKLPVADGSSGQVLKTDGSGQLSFTSNAGTTINNQADNRLITCTGTTGTLNGESSLTWDGSAMGVGLSSPTDTLHVFHSTDNLVARFESGDTGGGITLKDNTHTTSLLTTNGAFEINVDQGGDITGETISFKLREHFNNRNSGADVSSHDVKSLKAKRIRGTLQKFVLRCSENVWQRPS